jgi:hypothetical protein
MAVSGNFRLQRLATILNSCIIRRAVLLRARVTLSLNLEPLRSIALLLDCTWLASLQFILLPLFGTVTTCLIYNCLNFATLDG